MRTIDHVCIPINNSTNLYAIIVIAIPLWKCSRMFERRSVVPAYPASEQRFDFRFMGRNPIARRILIWCMRW